VLWLEQMLCVHETLEHRLAQLVASRAELAPVFDERRRKVPHILGDLAFFNVKPGCRPPLPATGRLSTHINAVSTTDPLALLGPYYVLEGSSNGAKFIARSIRRSFGLSGAEGGCSFLDPYGDRQPERWQRFRRSMNRVAFTDSEVDTLVAAAGATFDGIGAIGDDLMGTSSGWIPASLTKA
jgi:heme oxygenase